MLSRVRRSGRTLGRPARRLHYAGPTASYAEMTGYAIKVSVLERMLARLLAGDTLSPER